MINPSELERRANELVQRLKYDDLSYDDFYNAGLNGDLAYIVALEPKMLQKGAVADSQRLSKIFYRGVRDRMANQPDQFEKAFIYFTSHPFFIPVGNTGNELDKVLKMKETNEFFQLFSSPKTKARLEKRCFDYRKNSVLLNLAHAGYLIMAGLQKPLTDFKEYQKLTEEIKRLLDLVIFAASSTPEGLQTKQMAQVVYIQTDKFVQRLFHF